MSDKLNKLIEKAGKIKTTYTMPGDTCPHCGGKLRHEQNFHVNTLICDNDKCNSEIMVMPEYSK